MRSLAFLSSFIVLGFLAFAATPASAQATRTWVSGVGDDANPCSRTAPCKTFAGAISKTAPSGEINCLDPGGFGAVTITKSISLLCEGVIGGVLVSGTAGIVVAANATDVVTVRGLDIDGIGTGLDGIRFISGAALHVEKTRIYGFAQNGINFQPSGTSKLFVDDSYISENGNSATFAGIQIKPSGGSAIVAINNTQTQNNFFGIIADGSATTGTISGHRAEQRDRRKRSQRHHDEQRLGGDHLVADRWLLVGRQRLRARSGWRKCGNDRWKHQRLRQWHWPLPGTGNDVFLRHQLRKRQSFRRRRVYLDDPAEIEVRPAIISRPWTLRASARSVPKPEA